MIDLRPLRVLSSRITYVGELPSLDVSRGSGSGAGLAFAPSPGLFQPTILERKQIAALENRARRLRDSERRLALLAEAEAREETLWSSYAPRYVAELRVSSGLIHVRHPRWGELEDEAFARGVRPRPEAWSGLRARGGIAGALVLLCWCGPRWVKLGHCHRVLLGGVLAKLGAAYEGEVPPELQPDAVCALRRPRRR